MKAQTGGKGMSDDQVEACVPCGFHYYIVSENEFVSPIIPRFVDRYIPGYHFFGRGVLHGGIDPHTGADICLPWLSAQEESRQSNSKGRGRLLRVIIGKERELIEASTL